MAKTPKSAKGKPSKGAKIWRWCKRLVLFMFLSSLCYIILCRWLMPPITLTQLGNAVDGYGLKRDYVSWNDISPNVKWAAMASEDQLFPDHGGFDWAGLEKSLKANPKKKNRVLGGGASTISQQVAKNVFLWQGEGWTRYVRKVPEFYFTKMIEWFWGKKRILEVYLNVIEMGKGVFGIEAAAETYFHKHAKDLTRTEAAEIIACLPNPKRFTVVPQSHFVAWKTQWILHQMDLISDDKEMIELVRRK
jgi:monofunctional biosynthetic peptidoglycan transglycosylase